MRTAKGLIFLSHDSNPSIHQVMVDILLFFFSISSDSSIDTTFVCDDSNSDEFEPKNEFEGLIELFENETEDEEDGALLDIASLFQSPDCDDNGHCTSSQDVKVLNDGIILTPSMFIILLCLSVFAGIFIGKGEEAFLYVVSFKNFKLFTIFIFAIKNWPFFCFVDYWELLPYIQKNY